MDNQDNKNLLHEFKETNNSSSAGKLLIILFITALLGVGTGFLLTRGGKSATIKNVSEIKDVSSIPKGTIIGSDDTKTFKDKVEGVLKEGGIEGEGQFHLVRPGGDSQNVYLTSSNIDLSKFIDKKIRVWGQTNTAQKAGWLMDVGRLELVE